MAEPTGPAVPAEVHNAASSPSESIPQAQSTSETQQTKVVDEGEEQALESQEVIELQAFSERKAWIEEKITFLESLPPIDVFAGLDCIRASAEEVPGLPTRKELEALVAEHDAIEKTTEIFDTGDLKKLRQLTKAATQRNLSPQDTDVIELTLTTIYELDKLLHLLRDRSDALDMMAIRLTWEENRQASWKERRQIIEDLNAFSASRARWNASIYDFSPNVDESPSPGLPSRRASIASQASAGSSDSNLASPAFSRSARFKLAELLSRDAAQFSGRVTSLKHGKVAAAGKALDKMIDHSRKPVPDDLLDEQDRVEEKCINELENIGKFTMNLVMQWRKADEIYVETMKDHVTASNLLEEIETAQMYHPTARQSTSFISRIDTILKRLALRGDPASHASLFPRPTHFLFPDQNAANDALIQKLSGDLSDANQLARKVDLAAKDYRTRYEAVKRVEILKQSVGETSAVLKTINKKYCEGVSGGDGDGSPPDLTTENALDHSSHNVFLALLPSLLQETEMAIDSAAKLLQSAPSALLGLDIPGIDEQFKETAFSAVEELSSLRDEANKLRHSVSQRVARLKESRKISSNIDSKLALLKSVRMELARAMDQHRWQQESGGGTGAPPTPESPVAQLQNTTSFDDFDTHLAKFSSSMQVDISEPLDRLCKTLEPQLQGALKQKLLVLQASLDSTHQMLSLLVSIKGQSSVMHSVRDDFHKLSVEIEDIKIQISSLIRDVLESSRSKSADSSNIGVHDLDLILKKVTIFVDSLPTRVPFIARHGRPSRSASLKSPLLSPSFNDQNRPVDIWSEIPFDMAAVDAAVRADSNSYAMRVNGSLENLLQTKTHLELAKLAKDVDFALSSAVEDIDNVAQELSGHKDAFAKVVRRSSESIGQLQLVLDELEASRTKRPQIARSLSPIRELLRQMDAQSRSLSPPIRESLYQARVSAVDDAETRLTSWDDQAEVLKSEISVALENERSYQEELRLAEERRKREEEERLAAEEAERARLEKLRAEEEERQRLLAEQRAEEEKLELERQRIAAELAEKERLEREAAEAERLRREEAERLAEEVRLKAEQEQLAKEEEARAQREREKLEMLEKLRLAEERLEEERRQNAENERLAKEMAEKQRKELEELERRETERRRLAEEQAVQQEQERLQREREEVARQAKEKAEQEERERLERERENAAREARENTEREERLRVDRERDAAEREARETLERERLEKESKERAEMLEKERLEREERNRQEKIAQEVAERAEQARLEVERRDREEAVRKEREERDRREREAGLKQIKEEPDDVFGVQSTASGSRPPLSPAMLQLQSQIVSLRKRLKSIGINEALRPSKSSTDLPTADRLEKMKQAFLNVSGDAQELPSKADDVNIDMELQYLRTEVEQSSGMLQELQKLVDLRKAVQACDAALSDLLEHVDSYPAPPLGVMSASHKTNLGLSPEEQLSARLLFTRKTVDEVTSRFKAVINDRRAIAENERLQQTWSELNEMAIDRIAGKKSRPGSVVSGTSSGRNSSVSSQQSHSRARKVGSYSNLSVSSVSKMLAPPPPPHTPRRTVSGSTETHSRSSSRLSNTSANRSVSGPLRNSLFGTTFASRQRTSSLTNSNAVSTPSRRTSLAPPPRFRNDSTTKRVASPTSSEISTNSYASQSHSFNRAARTPSRSSLNSSTWSRAPRNSLSSIAQRNITPQKKATPVRKKYIADPKSKLDMAVGEVVNKLPVGINIEGITESWRDQSGKYWIGDEDPKLCFCRILRSQTVMVRVGGGWVELSKFIKNHFADSFRIVPESPPRAGGQEAKWISSSTLLEASSREDGTPPPAPRTPEPSMPFVPTFALMTPSGHSPRSLKSSPSNKGSPLTPLQFMRRAEPDIAMLRPATPSKAPVRSRLPTNNSTGPVWRP